MRHEEVVQGWLNSGVERGDALLLHSSAKRTLIGCRRKYGHQFSLDDLLQTFLDALGPSGTLLLPLFNFDFTKGVPFDMCSTPSRMGALTETARQQPQAVRTGHPIYSFCVLGAKAEQFQGVCNTSAYGAQSPFALLRELNGKIGVLGLPDQKSMTFYHHVEEMHSVDYRYHKSFRGSYTDLAGKTEDRTFSIYVRDLEAGVVTDVNPAGEILWKEGLYHGSRPDEGTGLRIIDANAMYDRISQIIRQGEARGTLYSIKDA